MSSGNIHSVKNATGKEICIELPPQVNTNGFWRDKNDENPEGLLRNSLPELQLQILVVFCMSQTFHYILKRFGMSRLTSEIIVRTIYIFSTFIAFTAIYNYRFHFIMLKRQFYLIV